MKLLESATQNFYVSINRHQLQADGELPVFQLTNYDPSEYGDMCFGKVEVTFKVPQDVDPIEAMISSTEKQIEHITANYLKQVQPLKQRIKDLQAITHQPV